MYAQQRPHKPPLFFEGNGPARQGLYNNALTSLPADAFKFNTALTRLSLHNNALTSLPADAFESDTGLKDFYLKSWILTNPITHPNVLQIGTCGGCTFWWTNGTLSKTGSCQNNCLSLDLSGRGIVRVANGTFHGLSYNTALQDLYLDGNAFTSLPADAFKYFAEDVTIRLHSNPLGCVAADTFALVYGPPMCPSNCTVDTFYDNKICRSCSLGTYTDGVGAVKCKLCPAGYFCAGGGYGKQACAAGTYSAQSGASACMACGSGKFSSQLGANSRETCIDCALGKYSIQWGANTSDACLRCGSGKYSPQSGANTSDACIACGSGKYSTQVGASTCLVCASGKYSPQSGANTSDACIACGSGKYLPTSGGRNESDCIACASGTFSTQVGANAKNVCVALQSSPSPSSPSPTSSPSTKMFVVKIVFSIPMSMTAFNIDQQTALKMSVARAAVVSSEDVSIANMEALSPGTRRLLSESIRAEIHVKVAEREMADETARRLTPFRINRELAKEGLPAVVVTEPASVHEASVSSVPSKSSPSVVVVIGLRVTGSSVGVVIGLTVTALMVVLGVIAACVWQHKMSLAVKRPLISSSRVAPLEAVEIEPVSSVQYIERGSNLAAVQQR